VKESAGAILDRCFDPARIGLVESVLQHLASNSDETADLSSYPQITGAVFVQSVDPACDQSPDLRRADHFEMHAVEARESA